MDFPRYLIAREIHQPNMSHRRVERQSYTLLCPDMRLDLTFTDTIGRPESSAHVIYTFVLHSHAQVRDCRLQAKEKLSVNRTMFEAIASGTARARALAITNQRNQINVVISCSRGGGAASAKRRSGPFKCCSVRRSRDDVSFHRF